MPVQSHFRLGEFTPHVGSYELIATPYIGAFSLVHRCRDHALERDVAVKAVRPDGVDIEVARRSAAVEARVRAAVVHPHVLALHGAAADGDGLVLIGPWLSHGSLADLAGRPVPAEQGLALADGLGGALDAVHAAGWWHGDVSPANVLFATPPGHDAGAGEAVLADFGSARRIGAVAVTDGTIVATAQVTAPEVWSGRPADGRADLYSLGALLYEALVGRWPFEAADPAVAAELHRHAAVPRASASSANVGRNVERVLLRALAKSPAERFGTGAELAAALRDALRADGMLEAATPKRARARASWSPDAREAVLSAGARLDELAATLEPRQGSALRALLRRAVVAEAHTRHETETIAMQLFAPPAALLALEDCGAAAALAAGHRTPALIAAACAVPEAPIARLLEVLAAAGVLARAGDEYRLPPGPEGLYRDRPAGSPLREAAAFWAHLSGWAATGEPLTHMDAPDGAVYAEVVARAGVLAEAAARELAAALGGRGLVPDGCRVLDVGAGSGVWSLAVAAASTGAHVTAVDRPRVLEQTRAAAAAAGLLGRLSVLAGDWRDVALPEASFDLALIANVCHLEPPEEVQRLLRRVQRAVSPGGAAVVVDTMPEGGEGDLGPLLQGLHLALRTPGGRVHDRERYAAWLAGAGFAEPEPLELQATGGALTALVARRK
jgi:serine/threonine-protein kinase